MGFFVSPLTQKNIDRAIYAILPEEQTCINLAEGLRRQKEFFTKKENFSVFIKASVFSDEKGIIGILALSRAGVLLHCFIKKIPASICGYVTDSFLSETAPLSVMGEKNASVILEKTITKRFYKTPFAVNEYKLLILKENPAADFYKNTKRRLPADLEFIKPSIKDIKELCSLEADYQETEVLLNGEKASFDLCFKVLSKRIEANGLYAVKKENRFIAKAAVNASGFFWNQIGGVYTHPEFRNNGIGRAAVLFLVEDCLRKKKKCSLFVKVENYAARTLYEKLGFTEYCNFRISYF